MKTGSGGLQLFLRRSSGKVTKSGGFNDKVADEATIPAPTVAAVVTAAILIADQHYEIDVELFGADPKHWQTNVYAPNPNGREPLWVAVGNAEDFSSTFRTSIAKKHLYTIDWSPERNPRSVDGHVTRIFTPGAPQFHLIDTLKP
ncbi:hypothetical protein EW146_g6508 [Bondarzewia mesenterica]|uniref:GH16 domain-containing protein n=1 Tax=Bondarzewia mesenterica TaxID=1095465 RepID=A0A4S4LNB3_9AGAM|nr:hypothetical protein EW146_g6508 [Bondarzewia mesenterica]